MPKKSRKTGRVVTLDFSGVEEREICPEGDYIVKVDDIEKDQGDKGPYWTWIFKVPSGDYKGKKFYYITSLAKQALFNLRGVLEALGEEVPKSKMAVDPDKYIGLTCGVSVEIEKYRGKEKNTVVDIWNPDAEEDEDESGEDEPDEDESTEEDSEDSDDEGAEDEEEEYTGTIVSFEEDIITCEIDGEEVDVYTEEAVVTGEPTEGASIEITGAYDEDEDLIASEVVIKAKKKSKSKSKKKKKK